MPKKDGFPEPLFEDGNQLRDMARTAGLSILQYVLFIAPTGQLRSADPILGDLTVYARQSIEEVQDRIRQIIANVVDDEGEEE